MKSIKYFGLALVALLCSAGFTSCSDDDVASGDQAMAIKVFSPTKVVTGQPVTINGTGLDDVTEVVFPGGIAVTEFEKVSDEMIRVITPAGINIAEGGEKLVVRSASEKAESPRVMTQGCTVPSSYSAQPDEDVPAKSILKIFGKDMEFVNKATFLDKDDNIIELEQKDFFRIATNSLSIKIPANIKLGKQVGTFETFDGKQFELPEYNYVAASGGHWETVKKVLWENPDPAGNGGVSWNGTYRFSNVETSTGEEIYAFPMEDWDIIKNGDFLVNIEATDPQIRVTTGWWSTTWTGDDIFAGNDRLADNGDGTYTLSVNFAGDPILDVLDAQHLLLTGDRYTPLCIYTEQEVWVEEEEGHWERKSLWKNDGSVGDINWSGNYRFGLEGNDGNNECVATFDAETWDIIRNSEFKVSIEGASPQIRVTTGWWSTTWTGDDIFPGNELLVEEGEGKYTLTVNLAGDPILDLLDAQHLLFTGSGYKVTEIYVDVWVGGPAPKEIVAWENDGSHGEINWSGDYRFGLEGNDGNNECITTFEADVWEKIKSGTFYLVLSGENPQIRVTTGWWSTTWTGEDIFAGNDKLTDNGDGTWTLEVNLGGDAILDLLDQQHLLFTGDRYTPLKLYFK